MRGQATIRRTYLARISDNNKAKCPRRGTAGKSVVGCGRVSFLLVEVQVGIEKLPLIDRLVLGFLKLIKVFFEGAYEICGQNSFNKRPVHTFFAFLFVASVVTDKVR